MRTNIVLFLVLGTLVLLASCSGNTSDSVSQTETGVSTQSLSLSERVPERYTQYEGFASCSQEVMTTCADDDTCSAVGLDQCMMEAAAFTGERTAVSCDEFFADENRESCMFSQVFSRAIQSRDASICETLSGEYLERCVGEVTTVIATQTGDRSACDSLEESARILCNNRILMEQAITNQDAALCEEIINPDMQDFIEDTPEGMETGDIPNFEREMCIEQVEMFAAQDRQILSETLQ